MVALAWRRAGVEPFDEDLSRRLQVLNDQANTLTTEVIAFRKALPTRRAQAMEKRAAVIRALEAKKEEQRRAVEKEHAQKLREQSKPIATDLKRKAEVADTLKHSVVDITSLQVVRAPFNDDRDAFDPILTLIFMLHTYLRIGVLIFETVDSRASYSGQRASQACQAPTNHAPVSGRPTRLYSLFLVCFQLRLRSSIPFPMRQKRKINPTLSPSLQIRCLCRSLTETFETRKIVDMFARCLGLKGFPVYVYLWDIH